MLYFCRWLRTGILYFLQGNGCFTPGANVHFFLQMDKNTVFLFFTQKILRYGSK